MSVVRMAPQSQPSLPVSIQSEVALLGALLMRDEGYDEVSAYIRPEHFAYSTHGLIYEAIGTLSLQGRRDKTSALIRHFEAPGMWPEGSRTPGDYLRTIVASCVTAINPEDYAREVFDFWQRREAMQHLEEMSARFAACAIDEPAAAVIEETERRLSDVAGAADTDHAAVTGLEAVDQALRQIDEARRNGGGLTGISTGLVDLDGALGGLHPSRLVIAAGRTAMGKTALATNIARAVADAGYPVYFATLEMGEDEMGQRFLSDLTGIDAARQHQGRISDHEFEVLMDARARVANWPLLIDAKPAMTVQAIRSRARRFGRKMGGLGLIVVDYLQLVRSAGKRDARWEQVGEISRDLKALAKDLKAPVLALAQLSRQVEAREDKRPMLSDLRESGSIEQDADQIIFVYREEYYLRKAEPEAGTDRHVKWDAALDRAKGKAELILAKNRHGPEARIHTHWNGAAGRFGNLFHHQESMGL